MELEADYLVVGAGAVAMTFVDALIDNADVDVVMVDTRPGPGGHWLDAYPFVRLHQPSANYGVHSTPLGSDRIDQDGPNRGFRELAGAPEICAYFDDVMRHRFLPSGRVRFLPMSEYLGDGQIRSLVTGEETTVSVRRRTVDATYLASKVPATHPPPFEVADGAICVPVGDLVHVAEPPAGFVIVGGGKTSMDACTWLLEQGADPDAITWIRPRDTWLTNRSVFQPFEGAIRTLEGVVVEMEAVVASDTVDEAFLRIEEAKVMLRLDPDVVPTMGRGPTVSEAELDGLRRITNVVRLGHVHRIGVDEIVLTEGSIPTSPRHVHVHCAAEGIPLTVPRPVFAEDAITVQTITRMSPSASAAVTGFLEATDRTTAEKNALLPPNPYSDTPFDFLRGIFGGLRTEAGWLNAPDLMEWFDGSRLNVMKDIADHTDADELQAMQGRFLTAMFPAFEKLDAWGAEVSPAERERIWPPAA
jgi:hypothetical protein